MVRLRLLNIYVVGGGWRVYGCCVCGMVWVMGRRGRDKIRYVICNMFKEECVGILSLSSFGVGFVKWEENLERVNGMKFGGF